MEGDVGSYDFPACCQEEWVCWVVIGNRWPHNPALAEGLEDLIELGIPVVFILFSVIFYEEGKNHLCVYMENIWSLCVIFIIVLSVYW